VSVKDNESLGWSSNSKTTENVEKIREPIHEDRRQAIHKLAYTVSFSYGVYQEILTEHLYLRRIAAKFVPYSWQMIKSSGV
jgi:hypothetical protein